MQGHDAGLGAEAGERKQEGDRRPTRRCSIRRIASNV